MVTGFSKVEGALAEGKVAGLLHASDASDDGVGKSVRLPAVPTPIPAMTCHA